MSEKQSSSPLTPDFSSLVVSIASAALVKMGLDPQSKEERNMDLARYNIDMLSLLKTKTAGHLTDKESQLLDSFISDLQIEFVKHTNATEKTTPPKSASPNETPQQVQTTDKTAPTEANNQGEDDSEAGKKS